MRIFNKIINKYRNMSLPVKASVWFMVASVINKGVSLITTPIFTRLLSQEEYGVLSLYNTWLGIITIFATFELATGVFNKAMVKYEKDRDGYTSSMLFLTMCLSVIVFMIYFAGRNFWNSLFGLNTFVIVLMFMDIIFTTVGTFFSVRNRFEYKYRIIVLITVVTNVLATVVSLIFVVLATENRVEAKIIGTVIVKLLIYGILLIYLLKKGGKFIDTSYWKYALLSNTPLIPHYLSQQILNQSDRIMINNICGKADTGIYSLAYQLAIMMRIITDAIHATFMPWSFQCMKEGKVKPIGVRALQIEVLIGLICLAFALFAPECILVLGGQEYYRAIYIVPPVAMSIVYITMYSFYGNIEIYFEKTIYMMISSCAVAVANIVLNAIFIPMYGFVAAGYTTLVCYMAYAAVHYFFMKKTCRENSVDNPFNGKYMWGISLLFVIASIVVVFLYEYTLLRYLFILGIFILGVNYFIKNKSVIIATK